ncbi:uncharacterized protein LOC100209544 [Hydra vulgaris]|uniref:Uncharacterized protein LOC100209544 n=1 Tax=Hydra vulgaris TaxID=6087 RepID=A0ABM4CF53_HYDVU
MKNIILSFHSSLQLKAIKISDYLSKNTLNIAEMTEVNPENLSIRCKLVKFADAFLVLTSPSYQKSVPCMELINYAKDVKKPIYALNIFDNYTPFGGLGAISAGSSLGLINIKEENVFYGLDKIILDLNKNEPSSSEMVQKESTKKIIQNPFEFNDELYPVINLKYLENSSNILVLFNSIKCQEILNIIQDELALRNISYVTEDSSTYETSVKAVRVVLVLMTEEYENSYNSKAIVEAARSFNKPIIPICTTTTWKPDDWLGLIIAGKLFYSIFNKEQAYTSKNYSTPMNELMKAILVANEPLLSQSEKEKVTIESLQLQIEQCKINLGKWPPSKHKPRDIIEKKPIYVKLSEPCSTKQYTFIHYEVMESSFVPPKQLFDKHGIPIKQSFDCMISYQWNFQELVRAVYCNLHMANISIWFDISGGMIGNLNDAMATAIQSSKVVIVFLSDSYQKSVNCKLEFCYAVALGKAFIFVLVDQNLKVVDWIEPYFNASPKFDIKDTNEMGILHNGVPRIFCLQHAIRELGNAQPDFDDYELTEEILDLKALLNDALDEIAEIKNLERFQKCTRCNKSYDDTCLTGCKKHSAYYLGGTIIEGRWVCCNQQSKEAFGCCNVDHISVNRKWILDPDYGVYYYDTDYLK